MGPFDLSLHLLGFLAPALFVALVVTFLARWFGLATNALRWWAQAAMNFTAGAMALAAGLWFFGVDGKMATYAALVGAVATSQWIAGRAWQR